MKSARRIDYKHVSLALFRIADSVKHNCRRVTSLALLDYLSARTLTPHAKLVDRRRAKSIRRRNNYLLTALYESV